MKQKIMTEEVSKGKLGGNAESVVLKGYSTNNRVTFTIRGYIIKLYYLKFFSKTRVVLL